LRNDYPHPYARGTSYSSCRSSLHAYGSCALPGLEDRKGSYIPAPLLTTEGFPPRMAAPLLMGFGNQGVFGNELLDLETNGDGISALSSGAGSTSSPPLCSCRDLVSFYGSFAVPATSLFSLEVVCREMRGFSQPLHLALRFRSLFFLSFEAPRGLCLVLSLRGSRSPTIKRLSIVHPPFFECTHRLEPLTSQSCPLRIVVIRFERSGVSSIVLNSAGSIPFFLHATSL